MPLTRVMHKMQYRVKTRHCRDIVFEVTTFEEFVEYGKKHAEHLVDGVPWSFDFGKYPVTHETDGHYLISTPKEQFDFKVDDLIVVRQDGKLLVISKKLFDTVFDTQC